MHNAQIVDLNMINSQTHKYEPKYIWVEKQKQRKPTAAAISSGAFNRNRT